MAKKAGSAELLWGEAERPSRGPKPAMSVDRIVAAAIGIADAEGLGAVSMQRVAAEFGFTTMSLYRYVPGKAELIDLMIDRAAGEPPDLTAIPGGWRPRLAEWGRATAAMFAKHPWFLPAATDRMTMMGPRQLGWLESAVAALAGHGLVGEELVGAVLIVNGYVRSMAAAPFSDDEQVGTALVEMMTRHHERFPALIAAARDGGFDPASGFDNLEFGLERVLDGIEAYIESRNR